MNRRRFLQTTLAASLASPVSALEPASFDVVVYSGVPCGIVAAIGAAREGMRVLLLEPTRHVGGLNTSGLNTAETEHMLPWTFGGIALEFYTRLGKRLANSGPAYYFLSGAAEAVFNEMLAEAGVSVRFGVRVEKAEMEGALIRRLALDDGSFVAARVFIDAGYEGDLMARAGVDCTWGREAREEFNESKAGICFDPARKAGTLDEDGHLLAGISGWARDFKEGDAHRGGMNFNWRLTFSKDPDTRVAIPAPDHYEAARFRLLGHWLREMGASGKPVKLLDVLDLYPRKDGRIEVNNKQAAVISIGHFGAQFDYPNGSYAQRERIIADHTDYTRGLLYFIANDEASPASLRSEMALHGLHRGEFADNANWPYQIYVREARRMRGAYVVTQNDVIEDRRKTDSIAVGSHFVDSHHVQRLAVSPTEFLNEGRIWLDGFAYQIPYRALTPKPAQCENLLVPGAASYTHVAFCTYRLESTWMMAGHAAGTAAAMAVREALPVQRLEVAALQIRLRQQRQVVDFVEGAPEKFVHEPKRA